MTVRLIAAVAAAALLLTACGSDSESPSSPSPAAPSPTETEAVAAPTPTEPAADVPAELQFAAKTIDGRDFEGASVLGAPAVFWFWTPWCPVCQGEAPTVGQVADVNPDVTFVGVAAQDELPAMQGFVDKYPVAGFRHLADSDGSVWAQFGVTRQPTYAFVDAEGNVDVVKGTLSETELTERVTALGAQ